MKKSQRSLKAWGEQDWQTKSGKKSSVTGERYLPKKAIQALSAEEYARTTAEKRKSKEERETIFFSTKANSKKDGTL
tara:strand:+ start:351 stop:581 length:231 start_codon:yes stop_codon:yes gene_type:complete